MSWSDRVVEHPNRVILTPVSGETNTYDLIYSEGEVEEEGTLLNAENLTAETNELIDDRLSGRIYPSNIKAGKYTFAGSISAGVTTNKQVTFSEPFVKTPVVNVTVNSTNPKNREVSVYNVTTTGFTLYLYTATKTSNISVYWVAMEV